MLNATTRDIIRKKIKKAGLTQSEVALQLGVTQAAISDFLRGKHDLSIGRLMALIKLFNGRLVDAATILWDDTVYAEELSIAWSGKKKAVFHTVDHIWFYRMYSGIRQVAPFDIKFYPSFKICLIAAWLSWPSGPSKVGRKHIREILAIED